MVSPNPFEDAEEDALALGFRFCVGCPAAARHPDELAREAVELRRDFRVVRQRQRHARIEGRRHGPVVARERVVNPVTECRLDLLGPDQNLIRCAVDEHLYAFAAGAELADTLDEALRVADRWHIGIGDEEDGVGREQRGRDARADDVARVDDDVVIRAREHAHQLFDGGRVLCGRTIELLGAGQDIEP
jgi:hypothetical protein